MYEGMHLWLVVYDENDWRWSRLAVHRGSYLRC
jgi:hypothetical protein